MFHHKMVIVRNGVDAFEWFFATSSSNGYGIKRNRVNDSSIIKYLIAFYTLIQLFIKE